MTTRIRRRTLISIVSVLIVTGLQDGPALADLSEGDMTLIEACARRFVDGWLGGNPEAVMSTLAEDAVLIPHHGAAPIVGSAGIRAFWWPGTGPATRVTEFRQTYDEIDGDGGIAFVRGRFVLAFEFEAYGDEMRRMRNEGNYLMLLERDAAGTWRITHRIWNDPAPEVRPE